MSKHILYEINDNPPLQLLDINGDLCLDQCKNCGAAEQELLDYKTCEEYKEKKDD
jgi:hypothetical protein